MTAILLAANKVHFFARIRGRGRYSDRIPVLRKNSVSAVGVEPASL